MNSDEGGETLTADETSGESGEEQDKEFSGPNLRNGTAKIMLSSASLGDPMSKIIDSRCLDNWTMIRTEEEIKKAIEEEFNKLSICSKGVKCPFPECQFFSGNKFDMKRHIYTSHTKRKCMFCKSVFPDIKCLENHHDLFHKDNPSSQITCVVSKQPQHPGEMPKYIISLTHPTKFRAGMYSIRVVLGDMDQDVDFFEHLGPVSLFAPNLRVLRFEYTHEVERNGYNKGTIEILFHEYGIHVPQTHPKLSFELV